MWFIVTASSVGAAMTESGRRRTQPMAAADLPKNFIFLTFCVWILLLWYLSVDRYYYRYVGNRFKCRWVMVTVDGLDETHNLNALELST